MWDILIFLTLKEQTMKALYQEQARQGFRKKEEDFETLLKKQHPLL